MNTNASDVTAGELLQVQRNLSLQGRNTLAVPSVAQFYCEPTSDAQVLQALAYAQTNSITCTLLGGGSNLILAPKLAGLVCRLNMRGVSHELLDTKVRVRAAAGENWHNFVRYTLGQGWSGLEALSLIPGQVGAAPIQNIGAYGVEVSQYIHSVDAIRRIDGVQTRFLADQCDFSYRHSLFKSSDAYVITAVTFELNTQAHSDEQPKAQYPEVAKELARLGWGVPSARQIAEAVIRVRRRKLPDPVKIGNVGSVFKNPVVDSQLAAKLADQLPGLVTYPGPDDSLQKLAAAQLIDAAGWKGRSRGGFAVWTRQPLVIVRQAKPSESGGDGQGMLDLSQAIAADVLERYGVQLELEPQLLGFD